MKLPGYRPLRKVIRDKCLDCMCGHAPEVKMCPSQNCPLWPYRMGKNPYIRFDRKVHGEEDRSGETLTSAHETGSDEAEEE